MNNDSLQQYFDAWNEHDIEQIMRFMTEDCIFDTGAGKESFGTRYQGYSDVRSRFIEVWSDFPDVQFENATHFVHGDRACSEWTFVATAADGSRIEIDGCDVFTFCGDKIKIKNSFIKNIK